MSIGQLNIESKYLPPDGYFRVFNDDYSKFIRQFPLKVDNRVQRSDGSFKDNFIWSAVFDYDLGTNKAHQCADAVIYFNAMFKYNRGLLKELQYHFTNGEITKYQHWLDGVIYTIDVDKSWILHKKWGPKRVDNIKTFKNWIKTVWQWAGTKSLPFDTKSVNINDMMPGDIFNSNGHAITVVDVVVNRLSGHKKYLLAQSYMRDIYTGEETHILINPSNSEIWYDLSSEKIINTPEWSFMPTDLVRFKL